MERKAYPRFVHGFEQLLKHFISDNKCTIPECKKCLHCKEIIGFGISLMLRVLLSETYRSHAGSNLTIFLRPLLSRKQCYHMLKENLFTRDQDIKDSNVYWTKFNETYFSQLKLVILFPEDVLYYLPFLCYNDTFKTLLDLYQEIFSQKKLSFKGKTFVMLMWHLNGLVAISPGFVHTMWGESIESCTIVWLSQQK